MIHFMNPMEQNIPYCLKKFFIVRILNCSDLMEKTLKSRILEGKKGYIFPFTKN